MIVETRVVGERAGQDDHVVAVPSDVGTLRALVEMLVRHELAAYEQRRAASRTLRVLTPAELARGVESGRYGAEQRAVPAAPTLSEAFTRAEEAFTDGLYFAFLDDVQIEGLDDLLVIRSDSRLRLVRLVALAGG